MLANPWLRISFPPLDKGQTLKVDVENLSSQHHLAFKFKTGLGDVDRFLVTPNPGLIKPGEHKGVSVAVRAPSGVARKKTAKFLVCSQMLPEDAVGAARPLTYPLSNKLSLVEEPNGKLLPPQRGASAKYLFLRSATTLGGGGDRASVASSIFAPGGVDTSQNSSSLCVDGADNATVCGEERECKDDIEEGEEFSKTKCFAISASVIVLHLVAFFLFDRMGLSWPLQLKLLIRQFLDLVAVLLADPDVPEDLPGGGSFFLDCGHLLSHLLWLCSTVGLVAGMVLRKRRLAYPWLTMMVYSHLTTATTLFEIWEFVFQRAGFDVTVSASSAIVVYGSLCVASLAFGLAAIHIVWKEVW